MKSIIKHKWHFISLASLLILVVVYLLPYLVVRHELKAPRAAIFNAKALIQDESHALKHAHFSKIKQRLISSCLAHLTAQALKSYSKETGNVILQPSQAVYGAVDITQSIKHKVISAIKAGACDQFHQG